MLPVAKKFLEPSPGLCDKDSAAFDDVSVVYKESGMTSDFFRDTSSDGTTATRTEGVKGASGDTDWY